MMAAGAAVWAAQPRPAARRFPCPRPYSCFSHGRGGQCPTRQGGVVTRAAAGGLPMAQAPPPPAQQQQPRRQQQQRHACGWRSAGGVRSGGRGRAENTTACNLRALSVGCQESVPCSTVQHSIHRHKSPAWHSAPTRPSHPATSIPPPVTPPPAALRHPLAYLP